MGRCNCRKHRNSIDQYTKHHCKQRKTFKDVKVCGDLEVKGCLVLKDAKPIRQCDLPYTITEPGCYRLCEDLLFNPSMPSVPPPNPVAVQAAITIKASNVQLDFGCHKLSQFVPSNPSAQVPFCVGVLVPDPLPLSTDINAVGQESVYITGDRGIISDFSMFGIRVFAHTKDIRIEGITVKNIGALASKALRPTNLFAGSPAYGPTGQPYLLHTSGTITFNGAPLPVGQFGPNFIVGGIAIGEGPSWGAGPTFFQDVDATVPNTINTTRDVVIRNTSCIDCYILGIAYNLVNNLEMTDVDVFGTWNDDPGDSTLTTGYRAFGPFGINASALFSNQYGVNQYGRFDNQRIFGKNQDFTNVNVIGTKMKGDFQTYFSTHALATGPNKSNQKTMTGFLSRGCDNVSFLNCKFNETSSEIVSPPDLDFDIIGWLGSSGRNYSFVDCEFNNTTCLGGQAQGFHMSGTVAPRSNRNTQLINCKANGNKCRNDLIKPAPLVATGTYQECFNACGYCAYFHEGLVMRNCEAKGNSCVGPSTPDGGSMGFFFLPVIIPNFATLLGDQSVYNCVSSDNLCKNGGSVIGFNLTNPNNNTGSAILEKCHAMRNSTKLQPVSTWSSTVIYDEGDVVVHNGVYYIALRENTSGASKTPGTTGGATSWANTDYFWKSSVTYRKGSYIMHNGINYLSLQDDNLNQQPDSQPTYWSTNTGVAQGTSNGFFCLNLSSNPEKKEAVQFSECSAISNKGATSVNLQYKFPAFGNGILNPSKSYSSGFFLNSTGFPTPGTAKALSNENVLIENCKALDNVYGIFLQNSQKCDIRFCVCDNNDEAGYTDLGPAADNVWMIGTIYASGDLIQYNNLNYRSLVAGNTGNTPSSSPAQWQLVDPANPGQSKSAFQANAAFNNGNGTSHVGPNGNYNMWKNAALTLRPSLLEVVDSTGAASPTNPATYFANLHNMSTIL